MPDHRTQPERTITVLPSQLIDQIAAGEVIERPASVIKELIENSLDAGATHVGVEVEDAGSGMLRVTDNGHGMSGADIAACVTRHATSKIDRLEDLSALITYGFRGEALASISSVAHLEIISRRRGHDEATLMFWEGGTLSESRETGAAVGTTVTVRHLFFNTPARREFMRAPSTETRRIIETVTDAACINNSVGFSLTIDGRQTIQVAPCDDMAGRLIDLYGASLAESLLQFSGGEGDLIVSGFVGKPEIARSSRDRILTYVNNRRVTSLSLAHAATAAYGETIPRGRFPFAIIHVQADPQRVDVNVHPTKREVRFANDRVLYEMTYYAINKTVFAGPRTAPVMAMKDKYAPTVDPNVRLPLGGPIGTTPDTPSPTIPATESSASTATPDGGGDATIGQPIPATDPTVLESALREPQVADGVSNLWQFNDVYIAAAVGDELWIIDQHTAHERVLYEEFLRRIDSRQPDVQRLLFPESIDLEAREWDVYGSSGELLAALGFEAREFGERTILLEGVPSGTRVKNPVILFRRVLEDLEIARRGGEDLTKAAAASMACRAAVMAGDRLKLEEMQTLFARLMHTENPFSCPHGRPTMVKMPIIEFDKKFCRA